MAKSEENFDKDSIVSTARLAGMMGLTPRRLQQLVTDGVLETVEPGRFIVGECFQRYITFVKGNGKSDEEKKIDLERKRAEMKMKKARARREELQTAELEGSMYRAEDVERWSEDVVYLFKGSAMALPSRVAVDVAAESNPAACAEIIKREIRLILTELSEKEYDPEYYRELTRQRKKMELKFMNGTEEDDYD